ncbi:DUF1810 domain-containing protein [Massilia solisilvae]|uniref:DUF1810 domain-containing protein n=1 Tax=Massilia solisilvae TaxID=1811225 RepID=A0ABT2BG50_9BURK|nr:DUF1810 domain-containing protein [Massilia solisilvae]MCS0607478.1 DUF1810 domain-containing protein [Massilia solisilvae]
MDTDYDLERFVTAQDEVYATVLAELRAGRKHSHWMWFIFPQVAGLGHSAMAQKYAIGSSDEAAAYLAHPVLGPRLRECATLVAMHDDTPIEQIFDSPDDRKFQSSMTLFADVAPDEAVFQSCLDLFFDGRADPATLDFLSKEH